MHSQRWTACGFGTSDAYKVPISGIKILFLERPVLKSRLKSFAPLHITHVVSYRESLIRTKPYTIMNP